MNKKSLNLIMKNSRDFFKEYPIFLVLIVLLGVGYFFDPICISIRNQKNILHDISVPFILSIGQTIVMLTGGIDLSFGSVISLAGVIVVILLPKMGILLSIIVVLIMGMVIGAINGFFISRFKILPFIVTLSFMLIWEGIALVITRTQPLFVSNPSLNAVNYGFLLGIIPLPWVYGIIIFVLGIIFLHFHVIGRRVYQIGNDEEIARISGIKVSRIKIGVYMLNATISAFCGIVVASRMSLGDPTVGYQFLFDVIAATCLGGTLMSGGKGGIIGTLGGIFVLLNLKNLLILNDVSIYIQDVIKGIIILVSVMGLSMRKIGSSSG